MKKTIQISGMSCMHCQMRVEKALKAVEGVKSASVDFKTGIATVEVDIAVNDNVLKNAIKEAGYKPGRIEE
jgi:copper chaperone CopZ